MDGGGFAGGMAFGINQADEARNNANETAVKQQAVLQEKLKSQSEEALKVAKIYTDNAAAAITNSADRNSVAENTPVGQAVAGYKAHAQSIADAIRANDPSTGSAIDGLIAGIDNAKTLGEVATAKATSDVQGNQAGADAYNKLSGATPTPAPAAPAAQPGAVPPTNIVPPAMADQTAQATPGAAPAPAPAPAAAAPTALQPTPAPNLNEITQEEAASAQPLPIGAGGRIDASKIEVGTVYSNKSGVYAIWDGSVDQNGQPQFSPVDVSSPPAADYSRLQTGPATVSAKDVGKIPDNTPDPQTVKALVEGDIPMPPLGRNPKNAALINAARTVDPSLNADRYKMRQIDRVGSMRIQKTAGNQMIAHMKEMSDAFKQLKTHNLTSLTKAKQFFQGQEGDNPVEAFETAKNAFTEELTKMWQAGKASLDELNNWRAVMDRIDTPETFDRTMRTVARLIDGAGNAQVGAYHAVVGHNNKWFTPQSRAILSYFRHKGSGEVGGLPSIPNADLSSLDQQPTTVIESDTGP